MIIHEIMKVKKVFSIILGLSIQMFIYSCYPSSSAKPEFTKKQEVSKITVPLTENIKPDTGRTIISRFQSPSDFDRIQNDSNSFAYFLQNTPLKPHNSVVKYYNGLEKANYSVYLAVVDLQIGKKNLHQCADAIMRLRADYLFKEKRYSEIHFNLTNGFLVDYSKWKQGYRVRVEGNKTTWFKKRDTSNTYKDYWNYLEFVFTYAGTLSLSKELQKIDVSDVKIGDVLIVGGSPGHAVIIMDETVNKVTGKKLFILAQSYMPAQEIQILENRMASHTKSPWFSFETSEFIETPEWKFSIDDFKRFY